VGNECTNRLLDVESIGVTIHFLLWGKREAAAAWKVFNHAGF
jgi:hypothetical protein